MIKLRHYTFAQLQALSSAEIEILCRGRPVVEFFHDFVKEPSKMGQLVGLERCNGAIITKIVALKNPKRRRDNDGEERSKGTTITLGKQDSLQIL